MSGRFPDNIRQQQIAAFANYADIFKQAEQSDGSDALAILHQLVEAIGEVSRAMNVSGIFKHYIDRVLGPPPLRPTEADRDPAVRSQWEDDFARWSMEAWQLWAKVFGLPAYGNHPMFDVLHNDMDRALAGGTPKFIRPIAAKHGNTRDVLRRTACDAAVYTVILAAAELEGDERIQQVLDKANAGVSARNFTEMRQNVGDKTTLDRIMKRGQPAPGQSADAAGRRAAGVPSAAWPSACAASRATDGSGTDRRPAG
jgi:hypothetical protein